MNIPIDDLSDAGTDNEIHDRLDKTVHTDKSNKKRPQRIHRHTGIRHSRKKAVVVPKEKDDTSHKKNRIEKCRGKTGYHIGNDLRLIDLLSA